MTQPQLTVGRETPLSRVLTCWRRFDPSNVPPAAVVGRWLLAVEAQTIADAVETIGSAGPISVDRVHAAVKRLRLLPALRRVS